MLNVPGTQSAHSRWKQLFCYLAGVGAYCRGCSHSHGWGQGNQQRRGGSLGSSRELSWYRPEGQGKQWSLDPQRGSPAREGCRRESTLRLALLLLFELPLGLLVAKPSQKPGVQGPAGDQQPSRPRAAGDRSEGTATQPFKVQWVGMVKGVAFHRG